MPFPNAVHVVDTVIVTDAPDQALEEKAHGVELWDEIVALARNVSTGDEAFRRELVTTALYGSLLSRVRLYPHGIYPHVLPYDTQTVINMLSEKLATVACWYASDSIWDLQHRQDISSE